MIRTFHHIGQGAFYTEKFNDDFGYNSRFDENGSYHSSQHSR